MATKRKSMGIPTDRWLKVEKIKVRRNGKIDVVMLDRHMPKAMRNVQAGKYVGGVFHPFRSSVDYDPDRAGDDYSSRSDGKGAGKYLSGDRPKSRAKKSKKKR